MAQENPLLHSMDSNSFHFPFGLSWDVYDSTLLTKYMFLNLVAAGLVLGSFAYLSANVRRFGYAKGFLANVLEAMMQFVREKIALPVIGEHDAKRFLPFVWTCFFFVLYANLLGMLPFLGSPTAGLGTTAALAICVFVVVHGSGLKEMGPVHYFQSLFPTVPKPVLLILVPIELLSHFLRPIILALRLFLNMLAGHTVLYVFISFVKSTESSILGTVITGASVTSYVLLSFLELLVAFVQAYVFTFLTSVYIGGAVHPHH